MVPDSAHTSVSTLRVIVEGRDARRAAVRGVAECQTPLSNSATTTTTKGSSKISPRFKITSLWVPPDLLSTLLGGQDAEGRGLVSVGPLPPPSRGSSQWEALLLPAKPCPGWAQGGGEPRPAGGGDPRGVQVCRPSRPTSPGASLSRLPGYQMHPVGFPDSAHSSAAGFLSGFFFFFK